MTDTTKPGASPSLPGHEAPPDATTTTDERPKTTMTEIPVGVAAYLHGWVKNEPDDSLGMMSWTQRALERALAAQDAIGMTVPGMCGWRSLRSSSRPSSERARCNGHCHCHAGPDGLMHPPCCADCSPSRPSSEPLRNTDRHLAAQFGALLANIRNDAITERADEILRLLRDDAQRFLATLDPVGVWAQTLRNMAASPPPSPEPGERARALEEAARRLVEAVDRCALDFTNAGWTRHRLALEGHLEDARREVKRALASAPSSSPGPAPATTILEDLGAATTDRDLYDVQERARAFLAAKSTCGCAESYPQLVPGRVSHGPGCRSAGPVAEEGALRERVEPLMAKWLAKASVALDDRYANGLDECAEDLEAALAGRAGADTKGGQ